jgi:hypothetical protein
MQVRSLQRSGEAKSTEAKGTFEESKGSSRSHHSIRRDEDRRAASRIDRMQDLDDLTESIAPSPRAIPEAIAQRHYAAASLIKPPTAEEGGDTTITCMHACMFTVHITSALSMLMCTALVDIGYMA